MDVIVYYMRVQSYIDVVREKFQYIKKKYFLSSRAKKEIILKQFTNDVPYKPDFDSPTTFNEKLQWLKLYYRNNLLTVCADKYKVREYVQKRAGYDILTKLYGVYTSADKIDFAALPEKFVLKSNNGSNTNIICKNKARLDKEKTVATLKKWLNPINSHYFYSFEWGYKHIKPRIVCEEYLQHPHKSDLVDYKFFCFNGEPKVVLVASDRSENLRIDFFDLRWQRLKIQKTAPNHKTLPRKPHNLKKMIDVARNLSKPFPFVRVDLYNISGEIRFGELTFYPDNGIALYHPISWDKKLGDCLQLPQKTGFIKKILVGSKALLENIR